MVTHADPVAATPTLDPAIRSLVDAGIAQPFDHLVRSLPVGHFLPLQSVDPAAGTPLQFLGTFVLAVLFYAITAHVAARFVLGETPLKLALGVGVAPALASILLQQYGFLVVAPTALLLDFAAFHALYRIRYRTAAIAAIMHFTISVIVGLALSTVLAIVLA